MSPKWKVLLIAFIATVLAVALVAVVWPRERHWIPQGKKSSPITQLMLAAGEGDVERVNELLQDGDDINEATRLGHTALYFAIRGHNHDLALILIASGANPNLGRDIVAQMIVEVIESEDAEFLPILLESMDKNNLGCRHVLKLFVERCDLEGLDVLLRSMGEQTSWGVGVVRESHFMNSDCVTDLMGLLDRLEN